MKFSKCLSNPPFLLCNSIEMINSFLNSRISANYDKMERLTANGEFLIKWLFLFNRICINTSNFHAISCNQKSEISYLSTSTLSGVYWLVKKIYNTFASDCNISTQAKYKNKINIIQMDFKIKYRNYIFNF